MNGLGTRLYNKYILKCGIQEAKRCIDLSRDQTRSSWTTEQCHDIDFMPVSILAQTERQKVRKVNPWQHRLHQYGRHKSVKAFVRKGMSLLHGEKGGFCLRGSIMCGRCPGPVRNEGTAMLSGSYFFTTLTNSFSCILVTSCAGFCQIINYRPESSRSYDNMDGSTKMTKVTTTAVSKDPSANRKKRPSRSSGPVSYRKQRPIHRYDWDDEVNSFPFRHGRSLI